MASKRGKTIKGEAREIVASVLSVCDEEARNKCFKLPVTSATARAALYTGVSQRTVCTIRKENEERNKNSPGKPLPSPGTKRPRPSIIEKIDQADFSIIRRLVEKFYCEYNVVPTCNKLLVKLKSELQGFVKKTFKS